MKLTHSKTASRRAHHRAGTARFVTTPTGVRRKHFMDPVTGMYRGKEIVSMNKADKAVQAPSKALPEGKVKEVKKKVASKST